MTDSFKHKLQQWEPTPPQGVWDDIAARLDEEQSSFTHKLYAFEAMPSTLVWDKIAGQLPQEKDKGALIRKLKWNQWAAAAAVLFLILSTYYLLNQKKSTQTLAVSNSSVLSIPKTKSKPSTINEQASAGENNSPQVNEAAVSSPPARNSEKKVSSVLKLVSALQTLAMEEGERLSPNSFIPGHVNSERAIAFSAAEDKYMVYSDEDGNAMRVPRQLFESIICSKDESNCKRKKAILQAQLASTTLSTDFTGVLEMLSNLKENQ